MARRRLDPDARRRSTRSARRIGPCTSPTRSRAFPRPSASSRAARRVLRRSRPTRYARASRASGWSQGVEIVPGFFADTLAALADRHWAVVRLDADTYEATRTALEALYPRLSVGGYLIVDDYGVMADKSAAARSTSSAPRTASPSRWSRSTGRVCAGGARATRRSRSRRPAAPARAGRPAARAGAPHVPTGARAGARARGRGATRAAGRAVVAASPMIVFGSAITRPDVYRACAAPGIRLAAEPGRDRLRRSRRWDDLPELQRLLDRAAGARRPGGAGARAPGRRDRRAPDFCATIRATLADPGRRRGRLRRRRSGCAASPGGRARSRWASFINRYAGARRRRSALVLLELGRGAGLRADRRGRHARRLRCSCCRHGSCATCASTRHSGLPRLRPRLLPAGPRGGPQGRHRRLPGDPPPPLEMVRDPDEWVDAHMRVAEKWDGRMPASATRAGTWRERALRAEAERDAARADAHTTALAVDARTRAPAQLEETPARASPGG